MSSIKVQITETAQLDALLAKVDIALRGKAMVSAMRESLDPMLQKTKDLVPVGGPRVGKKSGKKHLRDSMTKVVRDYGERIVGLVGPRRPEGSHAHLVEFGHDVKRGGKVVGRAPPYPFMRPAAEQTKSIQVSTFTASISKAAEEASK